MNPFARLRPSVLARIALLMALGAWHLAPALFADSSSTSYSLESDAFSGGGVLSTTSAAYTIEEGTIGLTETTGLSSTSYQVNGSIGIGASLVPIISSITPNSFSKHFTDESPSFTVTAQDPDSDPMEYQLKMDGTVKTPFQASNILSHALSSSDRGRHTYSVEVRDNSDGATVRDQAAYVFRRPVK